MDQSTFYKYASIALLILNIGILSFFFLTKPQGPHPGRLHNQNPHGLFKFDQDQDHRFTVLANDHIDLMKTYNNNQREILKSYFDDLLNPEMLINKDSLLNQSLAIEKNKVESTYQHFLDIKTILKKDQEEYFDLFAQQALDRILFQKKSK